ncbi:hypothetical protein Tco_1490647 [Tanacetum coccineum]
MKDHNDSLIAQVNSKTVENADLKAKISGKDGRRNITAPELQDEMNRSFIAQIKRSEVVAREVHATHARIVSGPDLEPMQEDQTGSNSGKLHVSLAGPNPEHMDDEFLATAYPKVHENEAP